ncbi:DNA (cytosine-5-)-methyltransferase [Loktanella sp. 3ANDIMAR09]|uniref:DNA cytosine methyltransferase n=1 Tax=Loktanella sp. 3ANDIMAR09 TaxID=1225657 RepID=UPI000707AD79|nr:DNA (cytosine-5-)-methyltransferase [Loktanella sp. 3ANDIMAR09]
MTKLRVLDLFSGIGGFSLGLERTGGFETVAFCEIEDFPRRVLAKHWPEVPQYDDVRTLTGARLAADGIAVDVITGGFPCQDLSTAGRQAGMGEGTRSGLWSEIVRLIGELQPRYVIVENVANLLSGPSEKRGGWFGRVLGDLAESGYDAEWRSIPASNLGAWHKRERIWVIAYPNAAQDRRQVSGRGNIGRLPNPKISVQLWAELGRICASRDAATLRNATSIGQSRSGKPVQSISAEAATHRQAVGLVAGGIGSIWRSEPDVGRVANGVPQRVDRLGGLGNAVVPQIPEMIGHAILAAEAAQ